MARKLRIQYEGALYHVINRGNYRRDVFESVGAAQAFEEALMETCEVNGWRLHGYVVMRNHSHLAVETPRANLVEGYALAAEHVCDSVQPVAAGARASFSGAVSGVAHRGFGGIGECGGLYSPESGACGDGHTGTAGRISLE